MLPAAAPPGIFLWAEAGDAARFSGLFRQTWARLPLWVRRRLRRHWREGLPSPEISLVPTLIEDGSPAYGSAGRRGHRLRFAAQSVDAMPDAVVQDLVAHELAHVLQNALGLFVIRRPEEDSDLFGYPNGAVFGVWEMETEADDWIEDWGFDHDSIDDWALETGRARVREVSLEEYLEHKIRFGR
jgi:hypothetical protein